MASPAEELDSAGVIAMVAQAPIIMVMLIGFLYPPDNGVDGDPYQLNEPAAADLAGEPPKEGSAEKPGGVGNNGYAPERPNRNDAVRHGYKKPEEGDLNDQDPPT